MSSGEELVRDRGRAHGSKTNETPRAGNATRAERHRGGRARRRTHLYAWRTAFESKSSDTPSTRSAAARFIVLARPRLAGRAKSRQHERAHRCWSSSWGGSSSGFVVRSNRCFTDRSSDVTNVHRLWDRHSPVAPLPSSPPLRKRHEQVHELQRVPLLVSSLLRPALGEPRPPPDEKRARGGHGDDDERFRRDLALPDAPDHETKRDAGGPPLRRRRRRGAHLRSLRERECERE